MENFFFVSIVISVVYIIFKFIEMKFIEKEFKSLKIIIKDTIIVYICSVLGLFVIDQFKPIIKNSTQVFVDNPDF